VFLENSFVPARGAGATAWTSERCDAQAPPPGPPASRLCCAAHAPTPHLRISASSWCCHAPKVPPEAPPRTPPPLRRHAQPPPPRIARLLRPARPQAPPPLRVSPPLCAATLEVLPPLRSRLLCAATPRRPPLPDPTFSTAASRPGGPPLQHLTSLCCHAPLAPRPGSHLPHAATLQAPPPRARLRPRAHPRFPLSVASFSLAPGVQWYISGPLAKKETGKRGLQTRA